MYPPTVAWQRFNNGPDHASLTSDPGGGYWVEHTLGYLYTSGDATGTRPVYTCLAGGTESFTSLSATCEGQPIGGQLGWLYASKPAEIATRPVYRCMIGNDHFDSGASDCEGQVVESLIG
nr:S8 family peptidase [Micromonospora sp. DSM 115978]